MNQFYLELIRKKLILYLITQANIYYTWQTQLYTTITLTY